MATQLKKTLKMVNYPNQPTLDIQFGDSQASQDKWYFVDWDLDSNGNLAMLTQQEAVVQSVLKCVFTEKQPSGYGTNLANLIGEKDVGVKRVSLMMDITMAIMAMKLFADAQASKQMLGPDDLIATMTKFAVTEDENDPSVSKVTMTLASNSGQQTQIAVL